MASVKEKIINTAVRTLKLAYKL